MADNKTGKINSTDIGQWLRNLAHTKTTRAELKQLHGNVLVLTHNKHCCNMFCGGKRHQLLRLLDYLLLLKAATNVV